MSRGGGRLKRSGLAGAIEFVSYARGLSRGEGGVRVLLLAGLLVAVICAMAGCSSGEEAGNGGAAGERDAEAAEAAEFEAEPVRRLAVGEAHACVLDREGRISCYAHDTGRELDAPGGRFRSISAAGASTCALREDWTATCWSRLKLVDLEPPNGGYRDVAAAGERACGVRRTGRIECWGASAVEQPPTESFLAISADEQHACALSAGGEVSCWNFSGPEICDESSDRGITGCSGGTAGGRARPPGDLRFDEYDERRAVSISSGRQRSCAILETGNVTCWSDGWWLGTPPQEGVRFKSVSAGDSISCGITEQDALACWGQVIGTPLQKVDGEYVAVAAGTRVICAIRADDEMECWQDPQLDAAAYPRGSDRFRAVSAGGAAVCGVTLGDRLLCWNSAPNPRSWPADPPDGRYRSVAVASRHACGLTTDDEIRCWETSTGEEVAGPDGTFAIVSAGVDDACAVSASGRATCWGLGTAESRLGDPPDGAFTEVTVGREHACGLDGSGRISCWGSDEHGQSTPPSGTYQAISAGDLHTCAISMDGRGECWGSNTFGQTDYGYWGELIDAGFHTTCGVRRYGDVVCQGLHGNTLDAILGSGYRMISTGRHVVCVIRLGPPWDHSVECQYAPPEQE